MEDPSFMSLQLQTQTHGLAFKSLQSISILVLISQRFSACPSSAVQAFLCLPQPDPLLSSLLRWVLLPEPRFIPHLLQSSGVTSLLPSPLDPAFLYICLLPGWKVAHGRSMAHLAPCPGWQAVSGNPAHWAIEGRAFPLSSFSSLSQTLHWVTSLTL